MKDRARGAREDARDPGGEAAAADGHMQSSSPLVVVGLGASAGGITALERFFDAMPSDSGGAFVIVVHLDPTHASSIAEILGRHTAMPVAEAVNGRPLERDHVYVIAPNSILKIEGNTLIVFPPPEPRGFRMPIDHFFASLGEDRRQRAVGILLSGTGSDGTSGLRAIKSSGGLTMAQDPATADQAGMVRSAIEMGVVDHVLAIEQMPQHIIQYARHAYTNDDEDPMKPEAVKDDSDLSGILAVLRTRVRLDFSSYRKGTIRRRMQRRMGIRQIETIPEYLSLLREDPVEVQLLAADMLIGVTGFFREREAWEKLEELVIRPLVASKSPEEPIRVWVPACASGEEAYSLTMMIFRHLEEAQKICPVQIFATDIDHSALEHARMGLYPESIAADVGANYLQRYFLKEGDRYKVVKVIRDAIVFAAQNLITDPPYSKLDLISCRNLLIYLEPDRQKRLLSLFHFALREGGFLFLGNSETIGQQIEQFAPISRKWRIYRRTGSIQLHQLDLTVRDASFGLRRPPTTHAEAQGERAIRHAEQAVLRRFSPACAIVDRQHEIRFLFGPTDRFLSQPEGALTSNVFEWCKGSLRTKLRSALHRLWERSDGVETMVIRSREDGRAVRLTVEQIRETRDLQGMALVSFQEATASIEPEPNLAETESSVVQKLEEELRETRNDLQTTIEELQTSNEEFKAVNEEALSINEELQSTNEELETSKEELQSLNEELLTVNFQLQTKLGELEQRNDDLDNLLRSTDLAAIFLDRQFRIKWFSPAMTSLLSLLPTDIGRPLSDFAARFTDPDLLAESEAVLKDLVPVTREIQTHDGRWYLRRLLPYRTRTDRIDGIVMTFTDVTASRAAEMELKERTEALETRVQQRTALLQLLYDIAGEANQAPSVAEAVLAVIKLVAVNGGWEIGHAWQVDESSGLVVPLDQWYVAPGEDFSEFNAATMRTTLGPGEGLIRRTLAKGETIWVDVEQEHFVRGDLAAAGIKSGVTIPILVKGRAVAALEFYSRSEKVKPGHRFLSSLKNVGLHLGYVIERQQLEKYIADQSDRERRTVGQELHDTVGQSLAAMAMMTRDLLQDLQAAKAPHAIKAARIQDGIESTKDELRKVIRGMLPVELDGTGLLNALIDFSERSSVDGTVCRFVSEDPGRLGIDDGFVGAQLFRIAQEAVRNALKHARASEVVISLRAPDGRVELEVADNGTGEWKGSTGGSGMRIMRYRADLIGGRIQVSIERGKGTRVACVVQRRPKRPSVRDAG